MGGRKDRFPSLRNILKQQPRVIRRCLKCDNNFLSLGVHNRVCDKCSERNTKVGKRVGEAGGSRRSKTVSDYH